jgi:hypothetical protein
MARRKPAGIQSRGRRGTEETGGRWERGGVRVGIHIESRKSERTEVSNREMRTEDTRGKSKGGQRESAAHSAQQREYFFHLKHDCSHFATFFTFSPENPKKYFARNIFFQHGILPWKAPKILEVKKLIGPPLATRHITRHIVPVT